MAEACERDLTQTVANHYNRLEEKGREVRKDSRIYFLRNFNNWVKSVNIGETLLLLKNEDKDRPITALDLCAGKGGDLLKWQNGGISKLVCVDIAATSVEQCESRYKDMKSRNRHSNRMFTAEFLVADCTKARLKDMYSDPNTEFDIVSCQFSFHYCFESFPQAVTMLRNACECLRPGGYFIGTTPNAHEIVRRLRDSADNSFGNEVFRVSFENCDKVNLPLFGAKYNFHLEEVVDCPEFLVYFPLFEKLAEQFGMKLVNKTRFDDFFKEYSHKGEYRSLLNRMQALEGFPPESHKQLVGNKETDYKHAEEFLKQQSDASKEKDEQRVGTLSQAEWDAATIYLVFVFQKMEGKSH